MQTTTVGVDRQFASRQCREVKPSAYRVEVATLGMVTATALPLPLEPSLPEPGRLEP